MDVSLFDVVVGVAVVAIGVYLAWTKGQKPSEAIELIGGQLNLIRHEAQQWVYAAEQLYESGQLPADGSAGQAKRDYVLAQLQRVFPRVPVETLRASIEVGVRWLKAGVE